MRTFTWIAAMLIAAGPVSAQESRLFGRGPEGLRLAVQVLAGMKNRSGVQLLSPVEPCPRENLRQCLTIVTGTAVAEGKDDITALLNAGGRVLLVANDPASAEFFRSLNLPESGGIRRGPFASGLAQVQTSRGGFTNAALATESARAAMSEALEFFVRDGIKSVRMINRSRYGINPPSKPSYTPPVFEEDDAEPRFNDPNVENGGYRYRRGQTLQTFKPSEYSPGISSPFVRYRAFDTFVTDHFALRSTRNLPLAVEDRLPDGWTAYEGKLDSRDEFAGGDAVLIPSLSPTARLLSFEVKDVSGDEYQQQAMVRDGQGSSASGHYEYRQSTMEVTEGGGLFYEGRKVTKTVTEQVWVPDPIADPSSNPPLNPRDANSMGKTYNWSPYVRWTRDALNNWYLHLPRKEDVPKSAGVEAPEKLRFTLKYRAAFEPERYLVPGDDHFRADVIPTDATVRGVSQRLGDLVGGIAPGERRAIKDLLQAERWTGDRYLPQAFGELEAGKDMALTEFYGLLSRFFYEFEDEAIELIDEYDSFTEAMLYHRAGVCRHRARTGYLIATYFGLPVRLLVSSNHAFLEAAVPAGDGVGWIQVDLGGGESTDVRAAFIQPPVVPTPPEPDFAPPETSFAWAGQLVAYTALLGGAAFVAWLALRLVSLGRARRVLRRLSQAREDEVPGGALVTAELMSSNYRAIAVAVLTAFFLDRARRQAPSRSLAESDPSVALRSLLDRGELTSPDRWTTLLDLFDDLVAGRKMSLGSREFKRIAAALKQLDAADVLR